MDTGRGTGSLPASLNGLLLSAGLQAVPASTEEKFGAYLDLILKWNARTNLTAVRDAAGIQSRHFIESIACAQALPSGIATLLDFGSGAGFPGVPIALCRPEITVTLAESQNKKAAFLQEAVRALGLKADVFAQRAEFLDRKFDCVTLRAVDRMNQAVHAASELVKPGGWLGVMTTTGEFPAVEESLGVLFAWSLAIALPGSDERILRLGRKALPSAVSTQ